MITPAQCRASRAWLRWTLDDLAAKSRVSKATLHNFERETRVPHDRTLADIRRALEEAGVELEFDGAAGIGIRVARPGQPIAG
ncbi:transcriptional regulator [Methylosinus sp. R-45379]|uniref:helix-turn-helix domain-containing protein n=1 Tax=Methylosinus sp. R-45379 TaxID=980563 RepID=UPI0007C88FD4|nr:helix-turn-helix transcriptional regulator [Methylosinus sp. R-45379]OAI29936.1 transcriptional regulator [Methylosinus sp. R-45379]